MKPQQYDFKQAAYQRAAHNDFQNVFDFPDFIEMRPVIRAAVHEVAKAAFDQPELPVKVERLALTIEEQLERETRKYERQGGVYFNQQSELANLMRLYTSILQAISKRPVIDQEIEDIIYAVNQTRLSLGKLPKLDGTGKLYSADHDRELTSGTFYYLVAQHLVRPYMVDPQGELVPSNVNHEGKKLMIKMTTYAFRDWDAYLTHQYDEQHNIKNTRGLTREEYYDRLEECELKYADHVYADVLGDLFKETQSLLVPPYLSRLDIMSTDLTPVLNKKPLLRIRFDHLVDKHFLVDDQGYEHVMDKPLKDIKQKYQFYRTHFE